MRGQISISGLFLAPVGGAGGVCSHLHTSALVSQQAPGRCEVGMDTGVGTSGLGDGTGGFKCGLSRGRKQAR